MIYKITFEDDVVEHCTAKSVLHLLKSYDNEVNDINLQNIKDVEEISEEEAKKIMVRNTEFDEDNPSEMPEQISLFDLVSGDDFALLASTEY